MTSCSCATARRVPTADAVRRADPTGTGALRREFDAEMTRRWRELRATIVAAVADSNALRLRAVPTVGVLKSAGSGAGTPRLHLPGPDVVNDFGIWLAGEIGRIVVGGDGGWTRRYVQRAVAESRTRVLQLTGQSSSVTPTRVAALESAAAHELRGVAAAVAQQCVRTATAALLGGLRPARAAREMVSVVRSVGERRGSALTDYVVVRAFNSATLDQLRNLGHRVVGVVPEHVRVVSTAHGRTVAKDSRAELLDARRRSKRSPGARKLAQILKYEQSIRSLGEVNVLTAGDDKVCEICEGISEDGPYDIDRAEHLIPAHPHCRCAFVPVSDERYAGDLD